MNLYRTKLIVQGLHYKMCNFDRITHNIIPTPNALNINIIYLLSFSTNIRPSKNV